jgi:hypothetical protein
MGKRARADSIGEAPSSPKPKGSAGGSPTGSAPSFLFLRRSCRGHCSDARVPDGDSSSVAEEVGEQEVGPSDALPVGKRPVPEADRIRGMENRPNDSNDQADVQSTPKDDDRSRFQHQGTEPLQT